MWDILLSIKEMLAPQIVFRWGQSLGNTDVINSFVLMSSSRAVLHLCKCKAASQFLKDFLNKILFF